MIRRGNKRSLGVALSFCVHDRLVCSHTTTRVFLPARRLARLQAGGTRPPAGGIIYFIAIGLGFLLAEMAMIQQLAIFLGHPNYALVVVLGGLILTTGIGSLASDKWSVQSALMSRAPRSCSNNWIVLPDGTSHPSGEEVPVVSLDRMLSM